MIGPLTTGLCDDAAVFPPGSASLPDAVTGYLRHRAAHYADLLGPLVLPADALAELGPLLPLGGERVALAVTLPSGPGGLPGALTAAAELPVVLRTIEVALPAGTDVPAGVAEVAEAAGDIDVYVEIPRDGRGLRVLEEVVRNGLRAKFRTGGVRAELYPDAAELAASIEAAVREEVAFKATAGLHHAVRNTDPDSGFDQHGFLNVLLATDTLLTGGSTTDARAVLDDRDGAGLAARLSDWDVDRIAAARAAFVSFGTCSISDPLAELAGLGLITPPEGASV